MKRRQNYPCISTHRQSLELYSPYVMMMNQLFYRESVDVTQNLYIAF